MDLGRDGSALADGTPDLIPSTAFSRIFAVPLPTRAGVLPVKLTNKLAFAKGPAGAATKASGTLDLSVAKGQASLSLTYARLADPAGHTLHFEDAPGAGTFRQIADLTGVSGKFTSPGTGALPDILATADSALPAGRRVELRDSTGGVVLTATFPYTKQRRCAAWS